MKFKTRCIVSPTVLGLAVHVDVPRRRLFLTLPFVSLMIEGTRPWAPGTQPELREAHVTPNELYAQIEGGAAAELANAFADELDNIGAENFLVLTFGHRKHGPIEVTIQRKQGKTPADVASELRLSLTEILEHTADQLEAGHVAGYEALLKARAALATGSAA